MHAELRTNLDLKNCIPMGRAEETLCAREYVKTRAPLLAERLVTANMRLVVKIARDYRRANHDMRDLIQEGNLGLMQAVARFDPDRGVKLCSYAAWWIRAYILKFVMDNWRLVKIGTTQVQRKLFFNLHREQARLQRSGSDADTKELAMALDVKERDVVSMLERFGAGEASLDLPSGVDEAGGRTLADRLGSSPAMQPDMLVETAEFIQTVRTKVDGFAETLRGREAIIFQHRFVSEEPPTLAYLAIGFGVSRERTRQLENRLKSRLREYLRHEMGNAVPSTDIQRRTRVSRPSPAALDHQAFAVAA